MILIITCEDNLPKTVVPAKSFDDAVETCLDEAETNGYIDEDDEGRTRAALEEELRRSGCYEHGDYTVSIVNVS